MIPNISTPGYSYFPLGNSKSLLKLGIRSRWTTWLIFHHNTSRDVMDFVQVSNPHPCWEQDPPPPTQHLQEYFDLISFTLVQQESISTSFQPANSRHPDKTAYKNKQWVPAALRNVWTENEPIKRNARSNDRSNQMHRCNVAPTGFMCC